MYSDGDVEKRVMLPDAPTVGQLRMEAGRAVGFPADRVSDKRSWLLPQGHAAGAAYLSSWCCVSCFCCVLSSCPCVQIRVLQADRRTALPCVDWDGLPYSQTGMPEGVAACTPLVRPMVDTEGFEVRVTPLLCSRMPRLVLSVSSLHDLYESYGGTDRLCDRRRVCVM